MKKMRVDAFADEHINDGRTLDFFLKYCEVECGWWMDEVHAEISLKTALRNFVKEHPSFAWAVTID